MESLEVLGCPKGLAGPCKETWVVDVPRPGTRAQGNLAHGQKHTAYILLILFPPPGQIQGFLNPRALAHHLAKETPQPWRPCFLLDVNGVASDCARPPEGPLLRGRGVLMALTSTCLAWPAGQCPTPNEYPDSLGSSSRCDYPGRPGEGGPGPARSPLCLLPDVPAAKVDVEEVQLSPLAFCCSFCKYLLCVGSVPDSIKGFHASQESPPFYR